MIGRLAAFILLSTATLIQTAEVLHLISEVGDNVTLKCSAPDSEGVLFNWYKQPLGHSFYKVATGMRGKINLSEQSRDSRFTVKVYKTEVLFTITNVSKEDKATYFCQSGTGYLQDFINFTFLTVNDHNHPKHVYVKQSPRNASVQLGDSVTLQCSLLSENKENRVQCPEEHSVHWFRAGSGNSHPGILYTHSNKSDKQEERSCIYSLSKTVRDSSDAGTYYCAVVTCGQILIGDGTKVETSCPVSRSEPDIVLGVLLACSVTLNVILICYIHRKKYCAYYKAGTMSASLHLQHDMSTVDQSSGLDVESEALNCDTVDFSTRRVRQVQKRNESSQECVYSDVRIDHRN